MLLDPFGHQPDVIVPGGVRQPTRGKAHRVLGKWESAGDSRGRLGMPAWRGKDAALRIGQATQPQHAGLRQPVTRYDLARVVFVARTQRNIDVLLIGQRAQRLQDKLASCARDRGRRPHRAGEQRADRDTACARDLRIEIAQRDRR